MKLSLVSIEKEGLIRAATDGTITTGDFTADGKNPLETLLGQTWASTRLLLDFSKTAYIDSSAIGWLIASSRKFRDGGGTLVIHSVQPAVRQILEVLRVGQVVPTASDEAAARKIAMGASA